MKHDDINETLNERSGPAASRAGSGSLPSLSFIIPVKDEEESLEELTEGISEQARGHSRSWEVIFIDDGSEDGSWEVIQSLAERYSQNVRAKRFRRNAGKAAALSAGYQEATGEIVFTLDADLQDDPAEIPRFLAKLLLFFRA